MLLCCGKRKLNGLAVRVYQEAERTRRDFSARRDRIEQQLKHERERDVDEPLRKVQEEREKHERERQQLEQSIESQRQERERLQAEVQQNVDAAKEERSTAQSVNNELQDLQEHERSKHKEYDKIRRQLDQKMASLEGIAETRREIISTAYYVEEVSLPRKMQRGQDIAEGHNAGNDEENMERNDEQQDIHQHQQRQAGDVETHAGEDDQEEHGEGANEQDQKQPEEDDNMVPDEYAEFDFSCLTRELTRVRQHDARASRVKQFEYASCKL